MYKILLRAGYPNLRISFGSYYITGDEWGMKKWPKYKWSAGKKI